MDQTKSYVAQELKETKDLLNSLLWNLMFVYQTKLYRCKFSSLERAIKDLRKPTMPFLAVQKEMTVLTIASKLEKRRS